jgi:tRNA1Val (adenine37-N6)-methyltransferase
MGSVFRFKKFAVDQSGCAMKINTDGVLLGVTALHAAPSRILDIGTGTGVIALMLAQRFDSAQIDAVEIDDAAAKRAEKNFLHSPFASRLSVFSTDLARYEAQERYDLIVSNPPYFVNDLKSAEVRKGIARHADEDFFRMLITKVAEMLEAEGVFWVIFPVKQAEQLIVNAVLVRLFPLRVIHVYSDVSKVEIRQMVCFSFEHAAVTHENFYIYAAPRVYTDAYVSLLKDFFFGVLRVIFHAFVKCVFWTLKIPS